MKSIQRVIGTGVISSLLLSGCVIQTLPEATQHRIKAFDVNTYEYLIGTNDVVEVSVWRNPEVSGTFRVKPDGRITVPLIGDIIATGKTSSELAKELENKFEIQLNSPLVTVSIDNFSGSFSEQVKIVGAASTPKAINYRKNMTLLDVMINVGGLTKFADGDNATLIRNVDGKRQKYSLQIDKLLKDGDLSNNVDILPGDVVVIPEAWF